MATVEQKQKLFEAKVAVALYDVLDRVPKGKELHQIFRLTCAMYKTVPGLHAQRKVREK
jgi:hypothetical protein